MRGGTRGVRGTMRGGAYRGPRVDITGMVLVCHYFASILFNPGPTYSSALGYFTLKSCYYV